ncbi:MAG: TolC family protein [Chlorobiaceae bacterium]|nr:TolC family protein [Chlorobiaceae bacterium]
MRRLLLLGFLLTVPGFPGTNPSRLFAAEVLTWEQCVQEASLNHPDLRSASEAVRQAEAQRAVDYGGLLPSLSVSTGGNRSGNLSGPAGAQSSFSGASVSRDGSWTMVASASQLLYDGGRTRNTVDSRSETVKAMHNAADVISASTRNSLRNAFAQLLTAQQQVRLAGEIADIRRHSLRLIGLLYKSGSENSGSLSKARADLAAAEFEVSQAKRGLETSQAVLCTQLGRRTLSPVAVTGSFDASEPPKGMPEFDRLVREHPSYRQYSSQKEASRYSLMAARSAFVPKVSLSSSVGNNSFASLPPDRVDWQVGVNVAVPIYQGGSGRATVSMARAAYNKSAADEQSIYFSIMRTLEQAWKGFRDAAANVDVQKQYLDAASERARIAEAQYSAGLVSFNEWTIIEDNLVTAKKSYLAARSTLLTTEAAWVQAKGGTIETR